MLSDFTSLGIDLRGRTSGQVKTKCPKCVQRKNSRDYSLSVNIDEGVFHCLSANCDFKGTINHSFKPKEKTYVLPKQENSTNLSDKALAWFKSRGISQDTLIEMGVGSKMEWMPQTNQEESCISFPFFRQGQIINRKYRDGAKNMKLEKDAELIFYNVDCLYNPEIQEVFCVEGEIDALSFIECGFKNVISVPNGASIGQMTYLESSADLLESKKRFYLAGDMDAPGKVLTKELARRLDIAKCFTVDWEDCKDANEYLVKYGHDKFRDKVSFPVAMPLPETIMVGDIQEEVFKVYNEGLKQGATLNFEPIDRYISFEPGYLTIGTGIPSHGKSEMMDFMMMRLAIEHDWKFAVFSPENHPYAYHISKMTEKLIGKPFYGQGRLTVEDLYDAEVFLNEHIFFINPNEIPTIDDALRIAKMHILRFGVNGFVFDPWNTFYHPRGDERGDIAVELELGKIVQFCRKKQVHGFLVAHPTKMYKDRDSGKYDVPTLYSIKNSSAFYEKADIGFTVYINQSGDDKWVEFHPTKVRFKHWGLKQKEGVKLFWDSSTGRYYDQYPDYSNWLDKWKLKQQNI